jgi:hypothetical protein
MNGWAIIAKSRVSNSLWKTVLSDIPKENAPEIAQVVQLIAYDKLGYFHSPTMLATRQQTAFGGQK